jgi:cobyrinic acid a,c-diamide synthase
MTGLIVALRKQGLSVSCCVTGPALHQALIYTRLSRRYSHAIDCNVLEVDQIISTIHEAERGADIVLIDGHGGFYDGVAPGDEFGSDADLAALTRTPALLIMDVPSYSNSIAASVRGFCEFSENKLIHGLVANRVQLGEEVGPVLSNPVMEAINACMNAYALPQCIAGLPEAHFTTHIPSILCGQQENVTALPREFFLDVASLVSNHVDIPALLSIAEMAPPLPFTPKDLETRPRACRIAVADDICFNVAYQDNLAWLIHYGAEIIPFSPLADNHIPKDVGGVYITGAYLDAYGTELSRNDRIR